MSSQNRIGDIEILRAIAVLMTVIYHVPFLLIWNPSFYNVISSYFGFWSGVDLFFVISGFVIAKDLFAKLKGAVTVEHKWRILVGFWIRRAWRILPSAWLWLFVTLLGSIVFNDSAAWGTFHGNLSAASAVFTQTENIHFFDYMYHGLGGENSLGCYWTLSLEEQFYIMLPLLFVLFMQHSKVILGIIFFAQMIELIYLPQIGSYVFLSVFIVGVFLSLFYQSHLYHLVKPVFLKNSAIRLPVIFLLILNLMLVSSGNVIPFPSNVILVEAVAALLVLVASYNADYVFPRGIFRRILEWIGARSYAIYLIHIPAFLFTRELWFRLDAISSNQFFSGRDTFKFLLVAVAFIIIFSELNYRILETPLRRRGKIIADRLVGVDVVIVGSERKEDNDISKISVDAV